MFMRCPGIEPGSTAWKAAMLTTIPTSLVVIISKNLNSCSDHCEDYSITMSKLS